MQLQTDFKIYIKYSGGNYVASQVNLDKPMMVSAGLWLLLSTNEWNVTV